MDYIEFITDIVVERGFERPESGYYEKHHIIPRCMNGNNTVDNLVWLTGKEHFIAHKLLATENPNNTKLTYAYWMMAHCKSNGQQRAELTPDEYEEARIMFAEAKRNTPVSKETRIKLSKASKGRKMPSPSEEARKKMSDAKKGKTPWNKGLTKETDERVAKNAINNIESHKGKTPWNKGLTKEIDERVLKYGQAEKGKLISQEAREKLRVANTGKHHPKDVKNKISNSVSKLRWYNNGIINIRAIECPEGFIKGRLKK